MCRSSGGQWDPRERALRGCTRTDLPPVAWDVDAKRLLHYHGRPRDPDAELVAGSWEEPHEPIEDGCPGGYQRSPLVADLWRYVRRRTKDGGRVPNPFFDQLEDDVSIAAVLYFEEQEDRARNYWELARWEAQKARNKR